jgi:predicted RNA binding protein YcfA (HicA-like mRNA interferase family)
MKTFKPKEIIKILEQNGFTLSRVRGSHHIFYNLTNNKTVIVPLHKNDLPIGTCLSILKQAGLNKNNLIEQSA